MRDRALESAMARALSADPTDRSDAIERLLAALLAEHLGWSPRASDGYAALREEIAEGSYFSVGKLWMIEDQSTHPVSLRLTFDRTGRLTSGIVHFGLGSRGRIEPLTPRRENLLLAYPHESTERFEWAHVFENRSGSWQRRRADERAPDLAERDEP